MTQDILALGLGVGAILLTAGQVHAQDGPPCADRDAVIERLAETYGETRQSIGLSASSQLIEVYASPATGSWTITMTTAQGLTCLVAAGQGFERFADGFASKAQGDPV